MCHISAPGRVSASSERNLLEPVELLYSQSDNHYEDIHSDIANMSKLIRDWEENHKNSLTDTVVKFGDFKDGDIFSIQ